MKLIIRQYVASLREREELDRILPDLLCELGYNVLSRPSVGTRQYGVDIAAVGKDEGEEKLFLLSVKQGDLLRQDWEGSPQALRPSLDEIRQIYLRLRVPREFQKLKVVICLCFGGDVHEAVQDNVTGYIEEHTDDRISFQQWNGDKIAGMLSNGILRDTLGSKELKASFQKAVAMVDEPEICNEHFSRLIRQLCNPTDPKAKERLSKSKGRLTAIRQLYLCLWILFVWARDAENVEGAYLACEEAILRCWGAFNSHLGKKSAASEELGEAFGELVDLSETIFEALAEDKIFPHVDKLHSISMAVHSQSPVDVNLKLFDLVGRFAIYGFWRLWRKSGTDHLPKSRDNWYDSKTQALTQNLVLLIRNNPALLSPLQDSQSIDITLALLLLSMQERWRPAAANWIDALAANVRFTYLTQSRYPTIQEAYRELLYHPRERTDEYRKEQTAGSTLLPTLAIWAECIGATETAEHFPAFIRDEMSHCNCQLWFPDEASESRLYSGDDRHGAMLNTLPIATDLPEVRSQIEQECQTSTHFDSLSAIEMGHWPILLMACRHYRVPVPPNVWIGMFWKSETDEVGS